MAHLLFWKSIGPLVLVAQLYPSLCNPMDCNLPGSSVHEIFQARILEYSSIPFPEDLPNLGIKPGSPKLQAESLPSEPPGKPLRIMLSLSYLYSINGTIKPEWQHIYWQYALLNILRPLLRPIAQEKIPFKLLLFVGNALVIWELWWRCAR